MASNSSWSRFEILVLFCIISLGVIQDGFSISVDNYRSAQIKSKRWAFRGADIEEQVTPPHVGGSHEKGIGSKSNFEVRQAVSDPPAPVGAEATSNTTTTITTTTTTTTTTTPLPTATINTDIIPPPATTTQAPASVQQPMANISEFLAMNYSYTDHTSFEDGTNDWDFTGTWSKTNLSSTDANKRPVSLPMIGMLASASNESSSADNSTNSTLLPDQNNFVMIYAVDKFSPKGLLQKSFDETANGEVFIRYYVGVPAAVFNVTLMRDDKTMQLYSSMMEGDDSTVGAWTARRLKFTEGQTLNQKITLVLSVSAPDGTPMGTSVLAVQHIAVGGMWPGGTPPMPVRPSNETVTPPGSASYLEGIAYSIYTALYVFLAFFLLLIVALVAVLVRGRLRQQAPRSASSDYDPNKAYRLDKVYDNPSYDASSP
ncbi:hypothetical protein FHG87_007567 [Trinorchestia longiramus]|nr:hypothetical protein FHG87_007567 [Trinorchestia longiramus]